MQGPNHVYFNKAAGFGRSTANGLGNNDSLFVYGDSGNQRLVASRARSTMTSGPLTLIGNQFRHVYAYASYTSAKGTDVATFNGAAGAEKGTFLSTSTTIVSSGYDHYLAGFAQVNVNSGGGADVARMYDSAHNDSFVADGAVAVHRGPGFRNTANGFQQVVAYQYFGGADVATLNGGAGSDALTGNPAYSVLVTPTARLQATGFSRVVANSGGGIDTARFDDSPGNDTFRGSPATATLAGAGFNITAAGFKNVYAYALSGGNDTATLDGSTGNDICNGYSSYAQLYRGNGYLLQVHSFDRVFAALSGSGGNDVAALVDGPGDDTFTASGNQAQVAYAAGNTVGVANFDAVYARGSNGGTNRRTVVNPLAYSLVFEGLWV